jgi:hypothetical protein
VQFDLHKKIIKLIKLPFEIHSTLKKIQLSLGRIEFRQIKKPSVSSIQESEFQVFSQWGEDGIIQYLIHKVPIETKIFVEFGVENYTESNTRFLLQNNNWSGLVIDASQENINYIKRDPIYWRHNLKAEYAFIDRENINQLISSNGISGDIALLSVDIDGNDYWVWEAINCINPRIVICEYNSLFGSQAKVTIPYDKNFYRKKAHYSNLYYGASISALSFLANRKGYSLVGSNSAGNNVFFVRKDFLGDLHTYNPEEAYVVAQFRESRDIHGNLIFLDSKDQFEEIKNLLVYDLDSGKNIKIREIKG